MMSRVYGRGERSSSTKPYNLLRVVSPILSLVFSAMASVSLSIPLACRMSIPVVSWIRLVTVVGSNIGFAVDWECNLVIFMERINRDCRVVEMEWIFL